jgi:hypothetical protein
VNPHLSGERRVTEGSRIVYSTTRRFDKSSADSSRLARVHDDVRWDKSATGTSPHSSVSSDTEIANIVVNGRG